MTPPRTRSLLGERVVPPCGRWVSVPTERTRGKERR
jgi:hypothetical protein